MKTIYLLLVTFALAVFTQSEPKHPKAEHLHHVCLHSKNAAPAYIYIHSVEEYDQNGGFTMQAMLSNKRFSIVIFLSKLKAGKAFLNRFT